MATQNRSPAVGHDAAFPRKIPFELIDHDHWFTHDQRDEIVFRRHAEIAVPSRLGLDALRYVVVRSQAELETLRSLLSDRAPYLPHADKLRLNNRSQVFFRRWTFIERVNVVDGRVVVEFHRSSATPGPFQATVVLRETARGAISRSLVPRNFMASTTISLDLPRQFQQLPFRPRIPLDDCLAYQNEFDPASGQAIV